MGHYKEIGDLNIVMTMIYTAPSREDLGATVESISLTRNYFHKAADPAGTGRTYGIYTKSISSS
ncbi:hypothetical protein [Paenibacillus amylolyticus]|uniref:Uncharacterized protein n=1 Tax=Paenibacillus amylolyticus TaxID=1451 RepID=A0ABD8B3J1_PAEAM